MIVGAQGQSGQQARKTRLYYDQTVEKTAFYCNWCATLPSVPHRPWCPDRNETFEFIMNGPPPKRRSSLMHPDPG